MYIYILLVLPLAINATNIGNNENNVERDFELEMNHLANTIQAIINSDNRTQVINDLVSDENKNELMQKIGKWFENGDITPTQLINAATLSFAGKFNTSPQFNKCIGKYTICTVEQCSIHARDFDSYDPDIFQCLGKCIPKFISCIAWAGESPISSEL